MASNPYKWACLAISGVDTGYGMNLGCTTNHACHLWQYWSPLDPYITKKGLKRRGVVLCFLKNFALKYHYLIEQTEAGDTTTHTFVNTPWAVCQTRWWFFHGQHDGKWSPSNSPIFHHHRTTPPFGPPETRYFKPNAHPESTSVDGNVYRARTNETFSQIRNNAGDYAGPSDSSGMIRIVTYTPSPRFYTIYRAIFLFDTSIIPLGSLIDSANLRLRVGNKANTLYPAPSWAVVSSDPATNTNLVKEDYQCLGVAALSEIKAYANISSPGFNTWELNPTGLAAITPGGITKLGMREYSHDALNIEPTWSASKQVMILIYFSDYGLGYEPWLTVTYRPPL